MTNVYMVDNVLKKLVGLSVIDVLIGPCGFHLDFGMCRCDSRGIRSGTYSLFIQCPLRITGNRTTLLASEHVVDGDFERLCVLLLHKTVAKVGVDPTNWSLRLLLESSTLVTAIPRTIDLPRPEVWSYYDHTTRPVSGFVVSDTKVALVVDAV